MRVGLGIALGALCAACTGSDGGNAPTVPPPAPSLNVTFTLDSGIAHYPGALLRAKGEVRDEKGIAVSTGITWELNGTVVAQEGDLERPLAPGEYTLCLSFKGKKECKSISVANPRALTGRVFVVSSEGIETASGVEVCANWRGSPECAEVSATGTYSLVTRFVRSDSVGFWVRCRSACPGLLVPIDTVSRESIGLAKNFSVLKKDWRISSGVWKGSVVSVDPKKAYARALDGLSFWNEDPRYFWRQQNFPIKVFFDRETYPVPITAEDSVVVWGYLNEIEAETGMDLFTPSSIDGMKVFRSPGSFPVYSGGIGITVRPDSFVARGGAFVVGEGKSLEGGGAYFSLHPLTTLRVRFVLKHEIFHALGFGHTPHQSWYPGIMTNFQRSWEPTHGYLAVEEVAYREAWSMFMELAWKEKSSTMLHLLVGSG